MQDIRHWYVIGTDEQQFHNISHWTDKFRYDTVDLRSSKADEIASLI